MLQLSDKYFKSILIKIHQKAITNTAETKTNTQKKTESFSKVIESLRKEIGDIKNQMEILDLKICIVTKIKDSMDGINNRMEETEKKFNGLK